MKKHVKSVLELAEKLIIMGEVIQNYNVIPILLCSLPNFYSTFITATKSK